jgi:hypothetical protein
MEEQTMTIGSALYLLMSIAMFVALAAVLFYQSWKQSRLGPEMVTTPRPVSHPEPHHGVTV